MSSNFDIIELFPTPVYATLLPQGLSTVVPWFYKQEMLSEEVDEANYGQRSKNSYILNEPQCNNLAYYILQRVNEYGKKLGYDYISYKFSQSWLTFKYPGQHHTMHSHPNSLISGVFYFGEPDSNIPAIKFHKIGGGFNVSYIKPKTKKTEDNLRYTQDDFSVNFQPGLLLLFPSYLHHSVPVNNTDNVRCSLAFNIVPTEGFGDERNLTELKF
jgi:uncharacterized protein (TIGR02466 family)